MNSAYGVTLRGRCPPPLTTETVGFSFEFCAIAFVDDAVGLRSTLEPTFLLSEAWASVARLTLTLALSLLYLFLEVLVEFMLLSRAEAVGATNDLAFLAEVLTVGSFCLEGTGGAFEVTVSRDVLGASSELGLSFVSFLSGKSEFAL
jgi:hypothetical protein